MDPSISLETHLVKMTRLEATQIADILEGRANEIAIYHSRNRDTLPYPVGIALERETRRYRTLATLVKPPRKPEEHEEFKDETD